jgi:hypothetical protein
MPNDEEIDGLKPGDMSRLNIPWHQKLLLKIAPRLFMKSFAKNLDLDFEKVEMAMQLFEGAKVHIQPMSGARGRGFILCLDNKLTLWFHQDGTCFKYDGHEMGEYDDGEVTVFDRLT